MKDRVMSLMKDRVTVLHQALNHLKVDPGNGHAVQKAVYLAQAAGAPMGYRSAWYPRGPHSGALAGSIYDMQMAVEDMEERPERELIEPVRESLERVRPSLEVPPDAELDEDDWLELLASYHYLVDVSGYGPEAARQRIRDLKPGLAAYLPQAERELGKVGLANTA